MYFLESGNAIPTPTAYKNRNKIKNDIEGAMQDNNPVRVWKTVLRLIKICLPNSSAYD